MPKELKSKCEHINCLIYHKDGVCNCDMARWCSECKGEFSTPTKCKECQFEDGEHSQVCSLYKEGVDFSDLEPYKHGEEGRINDLKKSILLTKSEKTILEYAKEITKNTSTPTKEEKKCVSGQHIRYDGKTPNCNCSTPTTLEGILSDLDKKLKAHQILIEQNGGYVGITNLIKDFISSHFTALLEELEREVEGLKKPAGYFMDSDNKYSTEDIKFARMLRDVHNQSLSDILSLLSKKMK